MSDANLGTFQSRAALRDRIRKAKRERRHSIGGLEAHIRRDLSLQMTASSNSKPHLPNIQRSSSCENLLSSRHTSPTLSRKNRKGYPDLGTRNISITSMGSRVSDVTTPLQNFRKFYNTSSVGSGPSSVGSIDSTSCGSSILLDQGQISMQQQGRRETLNLMARIAAKNSFSGHNYLQGLKYEVDDSLISSGSLNNSSASGRGCCGVWNRIPIANPSSLWRILWDALLQYFLSTLQL